jgi:hypothetical protein
MRNYSPKEIAAKYKKMSVEFAECVSKINEMYTSAKIMSNQTMDNADVECDLMTVLQYCAMALSSIVIYADEYEKAEENESDK